MNRTETAVFCAQGVASSLILLVLFGCSAPPKTESPLNSSTAPGDEVLAVVGNREITAEQLRGRILDRYYGPRALLGLIREALFLAESERLDVGLTSEEVAAAVDEEIDLILGSSAQERASSLERLGLQGLTLTDLRREIAAETASALLIEKVVAVHRNVTENEIRQEWRDSWQFRRRNIEHLVFPFTSEDLPEVRDSRMKAEAAAEAIALGSTFESAATGPWTAATAPEPRVGRGWVTPGQLAGSALGDLIFGLEIGSLSEPFLEEGFGYHLVRVVEELAARPYDQVREELREQLKRRPPESGEVEEIERKIRSRVQVRTRSGVFGASGEIPGSP